jgi:hypothetical protein
MRHLPWLIAGVTKRAWERARGALVDRVADLAWRRRTEGGASVDVQSDQLMQRLAEVSRGDRDATLYGMNLAEREHRDDER